MLILYILATCLALQVANHFQKTQSTSCLAQHTTVHTQVGHTAKKKNMLRYLSASTEARSSPPVATPVCLTNQRRQLWNYRFQWQEEEQ